VADDATVAAPPAVTSDPFLSLLCSAGGAAPPLPSVPAAGVTVTPTLLPPLATLFAPLFGSLQVQRRAKNRFSSVAYTTNEAVVRREKELIAIATTAVRCSIPMVQR
jgi:hypothetical protein